MSENLYMIELEDIVVISFIQEPNYEFLSYEEEGRIQNFLIGWPS